MKHAIMGTALSAMLILGGALNAAQADTLVFPDTLRPNGHDRSRAARLADGRKCGGARDGDFPTAIGETYQSCMFARGWALDHIIPDPPRAYVRGPSYGSPPPVDNSASDDWAQRQRDQDLQQSINQQDLDFQRMNQDQFDQQQQIINNNRLND